MRVDVDRASEFKLNHRVRPIAILTRCLQLLAFVGVVLLAGCGGSPATSHIGAVTASGTFQSGLTATLILPAGIPDIPQSATVVMTPQAGGASTTLTVTGIGAGPGGTFTLTFTLPSLTITAPTTYIFTASGQSATVNFSTTPGTAIVIQPGPQVVSLNPAAGQAGQTVDVTINGVSTAFVNGTTQASFGAGISVNGSASGAPGIIAVSNATTAVAHLVIAPTAATGVHTVTVTTGSQTLTSASGFTVTSAPLPPLVSVGGPYTGTTSLPVAFSGAGSTDPAGLALSYAWTFGDGGTGTGVSPTHTYAAAGHYAVGVVVTNSAGAFSSATTTATITDAPKPPVANAGGPYTGATAANITFSAAASTDPGGLALSYAWTFGDGGTGTGVSPAHAYAKAGTYTVSVTATNTANFSSSASTTATITDAAQPPVASVGGPYTGVAGTVVTFSGAGSTDPKGETLSYSWNFGDGGTSTGIAPTHTYTGTGTYTVSLMVTNTDNLSSTKTTTATITAAAQPPVPSVGGPYSGTAGTAVTFNGAGSTDPKGETLNYAWTFGDGGTGTGATPTHTYASSGTFTVTLTVTNTDTLHASASTTATIAAAAQPPVAVVGGPYNGTAGTAVSFNGSGSTDPKGETLTYSWSFGDTTTGTGATPTHTYASAGTYTVTLTVTNTDTLHTSATTTATIVAAAQPPVAVVGGPYSGTAGTPLNFNGAGSTDPKGETLSYAWTFGDGASGVGSTPTHTYATQGTYTVTLTVTNTDTLHSSAMTTATIAIPVAQPPVASVGGPYTGTAGTAVTFNGSGSTDPKSETLSYAWNFGDGTNGTGATPTHTYASQGTYTVTLTVTNTDSLHAGAMTTATIAAAPPQPPVAVVGGPYSGTAGIAVSFNGSASSDPKGETLSFAWTFGDGTNGTGATPTHTYATQGTYTVTLTVTNTDSLHASAMTTAAIVAALPQAPVANAGGPYTGAAGTAVSFNGSGSTDPKSETLTYAWSFGDGTTGTGQTPTHTYTAGGVFTVSLTVTNSDNLSSTASTTATITAPPVANVGGPYTGTAGTAITFNGSGSTDPRNETLTYAWTFGDGGTGTGANPTHTYAAGGVYTVSLIVTNADNLHSPASTTTATVTSPPVANAGGPYNGTAGVAVNFNGSGSTDPRSETLTYAWSFGDTGTATGPTPTHTYASAGTYTVTLTVTNTDTLHSASTTAATIVAAAQPPVAVVGGPYTGTAGSAVSFNGAGSTDSKSETLIYAWSFGDTTTGTGVAPTHTYAAPGIYTVSLTVTNTDNLTSTASTTTATITAQSPVAVVGGPYTGTAGVAVSFNGSASTAPNSETLVYAWTFGDGATGTGATPTHTYANSGSYNLSLTVTDTDNLTANASTTASIAAPLAKPPVANPGGPYTATAGTTVSFNGTASTDPKGETLSYTWNYGDGSAGSGPTPSHSYTKAGTYTVSLTVTNTDSASSAAATTSASIAAVPPPQPIAVAGGPYNGVTSAAIIFNGTGSSDPANTAAGAVALTYTWNFGDGSMGAGPTPIHYYTTAGTYTVSVTVTSASGGTASASTSAVITAAAPVTGTPTGTNPVANPAGPYTGTVGTAVTFNGSGSSDPNNLSLTYFWQFGDGGSATTANPSYTYTGAGTYSVLLTVSNGSTSTIASTTATIAPGAPTPALVANAGGPYTIAVNQPLVFDGAQSTNPSSRQLNYTWDFGDGATATGAQPSHTYTSQGPFTVNLNVNDGANGNGNATAQVTVTPPAPEAIAASAAGPYADTTAHAITFDASASIDSLGNALSYAWSFGDGSTGTGVTPSHTYTAAGTYTATVTVSSAGASAMATATVTITPAVQVAITSPVANALFGPTANTVTVAGTLSASNLTVTVNGVTATVSGTSFSAVGVSLREGVNLIAATATDNKGGVGTGTVSVILDATAPLASITSPVNGATVSTSSVTVAGLVNDIVTGTIGSNDVTVTVNGLSAQVANRSYELPNVLLVPGMNTITVVVTDNVGNSSTTTSTVQYVQPNRQLSLVMLSGNGQSAAVKSVLPQPLVVQLQAADGTPVAGRPVTFTVTRSDGQVEVMPTVSQSLFIVTDATGKASALFQLGSRAGLGVNQVTVSTPGAAGTVLFTADTTSGPPTQIHAVIGENQRGLLGEALAEAFQVFVADAYANPIPGVAVMYSVLQGDGTLDTSNVTTDSNGKAHATLTLGQQEGIGNYVVNATFATNTGAPVIFAASGFAPGPVANTSVSGFVLDNANTPIPNATIRLTGTTLSTVSDTNGRFLISGAPVGTVTLSVDGSTSTRTETFPFLSFVLEDLPGQNNTIGKPIYLPSIDVNDAQTVGGDDPVTLTMAGVPGVAFTIAPHSVVFPDGSTVGKLSLSQVKSDMVPMAPINGSGPDLIWTLQPAGTRFTVPIQVTLPNTQALPPGTVSEMYQYDHDLEQFVSAGTGHVSADGSVIVSDPGFGITKAGWGHGPTFPLPGNCTQSCSNQNPCIFVTPIDGSCYCQGQYLNGNACGSQKVSSCINPGTCVNGVCAGGNKPDKTHCDDGVFCKQPESCMSGVCTGTPIADKPDPVLGIDLQAVKIETSFSSIANPVAFFFDKYGLGFTIVPKFSAFPSNMLICCESLRQLDVPQQQMNFSASLTIGTGKIGIPYFSIPGPNGPVGFYASLSGSQTLTATHKSSICNNQDCWLGTFSLGVTLTGGVTALIADVNISGGVTGDLSVGCGDIKGTITSQAIQAQGNLTTPFFNFAVGPYVFVPSTTIASIQVPI